MENKEAEQLLDSFENYQFLGDLERRKKKIKDYINQLEKENAQLKQQLAAKDKALDKAIEECITTDSCMGCPCHCNFKLHCGYKECLQRIKEWAEHETN